MKLYSLKHKSTCNFISFFRSLKQRSFLLVTEINGKTGICGGKPTPRMYQRPYIITPPWKKVCAESWWQKKLSFIIAHDMHYCAVWMLYTWEELSTVYIAWTVKRIKEIVLIWVWYTIVYIILCTCNVWYGNVILRLQHMLL